MPPKKPPKQTLKIFLTNPDRVTPVVMTSSSTGSTSAPTIDHSQSTSQSIEEVSARQGSSFIWDHEHESVDETDARRWICDHCLSDIERSWVLPSTTNQRNHLRQVFYHIFQVLIFRSIALLIPLIQTMTLATFRQQLTCISETPNSLKSAKLLSTLLSKIVLHFASLNQHRCIVLSRFWIPDQFVASCQQIQSKRTYFDSFRTRKQQWSKPYPQRNPISTILSTCGQAQIIKLFSQL